MTQEADLRLDHTPAPAAPSSNLLLWVVAGGLSFLLWLAVVGQVVLVVPRFAKLFDDFKMKLPILTEWVIHDARWAVPAITFATLLTCIGLGRRSLWPWIFLLFVLPLALNGLMGVSLFFPCMELLEGLAGGGKK